MWRSSGVLYLPYIFRTLKRVYKPTVVISTKLLKMSSFCRNMACGYRERAGLTWATSMCGECITMSPKRPFVPKSDVKQWFTTTTLGPKGYCRPLRAPPSPPPPHSLFWLLHQHAMMVQHIELLFIQTFNPSRRFFYPRSRSKVKVKDFNKFLLP